MSFLEGKYDVGHFLLHGFYPWSNQAIFQKQYFYKKHLNERILRSLSKRPAGKRNKYG
jgi:hypothetical protein